MQLENENQGIMTEKAVSELSALMFPENNSRFRNQEQYPFNINYFSSLLQLGVAFNFSEW